MSFKSDLVTRVDPHEVAGQPLQYTRAQGASSHQQFGASEMLEGHSMETEGFNHHAIQSEQLLRAST
jgi:hypothetical protein